MMLAVVIQRLLMMTWVLAPIAAWQWVHTDEVRAVDPSPLRETSKPASSKPSIDHQKAVQRFVQEDPFRVTRRPALSMGSLPVADSVARASSPTLTLSGVIWGPRPVAIIQGWPGIEGARVVREGDVLSAIRVSRIDSVAVTLIGQGRSWRVMLSTVKETR